MFDDPKEHQQVVHNPEWYVEYVGPYCHQGLALHKEYHEEIEVGGKLKTLVKHCDTDVNSKQSVDKTVTELTQAEVKQEKNFQLPSENEKKQSNALWIYFI